MGPLPDPQQQQYQPLLPKQPLSVQNIDHYREPVFREYVTGALLLPASEAPNFAPAYYGYPYWYPYGWQQPQRKQDAYQLAMSISSLIGASLTLLTGIICAIFFFFFFIMMPINHDFAAEQRFGVFIQFFTFAVAGLVGGGVSLYHSIRALMRKSSPELKLPWFWIFLVLYLVVVVIGTVLYFTKQSVTNVPLSIFLISLAGILPALAFLALGVRRIHFPRSAQWPTTWRRFALSLVSGATLAILLAGIFEFVLSVIVAQQVGLKDISLDSFSQEIPDDPRMIGFLFILVSVIAPVVEEVVKPLAVVALIGRIRSAAEAFVLGMASGIGFNLVETISYIGMGYSDWLNVTLQRASSGLLHGFGAGMVALGWYFIIHPNAMGRARRALMASGCWGYAILQHAIWNGSFGLLLLPAPIGPYLETGTIPLGFISFPSLLLVYIAESILLLVFFLYVTKKLRTRLSSSSALPFHGVQPAVVLPR
jgi:RsiW-degrading membrane proteinase PrsW (M82 family)